MLKLSFLFPVKEYTLCPSLVLCSWVNLHSLFLASCQYTLTTLLGVCTKSAKGQVEEHEIGMANFSFLAVLHSSSLPGPRF